MVLQHSRLNTLVTLSVLVLLLITIIYYYYFCIINFDNNLSMTSVEYSYCCTIQCILVIKKFHSLSPRANYTDRTTAACRRSDANFCG
jgi:hypothetical protein